MRRHDGHSHCRAAWQRAGRGTRRALDTKRAALTASYFAGRLCRIENPLQAGPDLPRRPSGQFDLAGFGFFPPAPGLRIIGHSPHIPGEILADVLEIAEQVLFAVEFGHEDRVIADIARMRARQY